MTWNDMLTSILRLYEIFFSLSLTLRGREKKRWICEWWSCHQRELFIFIPLGEKQTIFSSLPLIHSFFLFSLFLPISGERGRGKERKMRKNLLKYFSLSILFPRFSSLSVSFLFFSIFLSLFLFLLGFRKIHIFENRGE